MILHTEWDEFKSLDFKKLTLNKKFKIYDLRNLYNYKEMLKKKIKYYSIGRHQGPVGISPIKKNRAGEIQVLGTRDGDHRGESQPHASYSGDAADRNSRDELFALQGQ